MSLLTVLREGGIVPYLYKGKKAGEPFENWATVPYYEDVAGVGSYFNPKQDMVQAVGVYLLAIVILVFGLLAFIMVINYLIGMAAARIMLYMAINILPHILGIVLFSYYYIAFIAILYYITRYVGKNKVDAETVILPGNMVIPPGQRAL